MSHHRIVSYSSSMPRQLVGNLTPQELADLLQYLAEANEPATINDGKM